ADASAGSNMTKGVKMSLPQDVIAQTEVRYKTREAQHTTNIQAIKEVKEGKRSVFSVDDPQRADLRKQRILSQPAVNEALSSLKAGAPLESLGVVETSFLERIISGNNLLGIAFLDLGVTIARTVGRIHVNSQFQELGFGTGFMISPRLLLTNNHVLP